MLVNRITGTGGRSTSRVKIHVHLSTIAVLKLTCKKYLNRQRYGPVYEKKINHCTCIGVNYVIAPLRTYATKYFPY